MKPKTHELQVTRHEPRQLMPPINLESLIEKAVDSKAAVDVIKEMFTMQKAMQADAAKRAYDDDMSAFQAECPPIHKDKVVSNSAGRRMYGYAPIEAIEIQIRPLLRRYGFSHTFDVDTSAPQGWIHSICRVKHREGHMETSVGKFPLTKGTDLMSAPQIYAATETFAKRRALMNAYGLVVIGEDIDGSTGRPHGVGPSKLAPQSEDATLKALARELWDLLKPVRGDAKNWDKANQWLWEREILDSAAEESAPRLTADKFRSAIKKSKELL